MKVIIVHGSALVPYGSPRFRKGINRFLGYFLKEEPSFDYVLRLQGYLRDRDIDSECFFWNAGIFLKDFRAAAKQLKERIEDTKGKVALIAKSNGAIIANMASNGLEHRIQKIIQIGCPIIPRYFSREIPITNIYSPTDRTQGNGIILNSMQSLSLCRRKVEADNVRNIELGGLDHAGLNSTDCFELYYKELESN
jgi:hypothetical protein